MEFGNLVQTLFTSRIKKDEQPVSVLNTVPTNPIPETTYYNMSTAVSESMGISNEEFRLNRVKEVYPDYNPAKMIADSEAKIPKARRQEYQQWRGNLGMNGTDYDYAKAFMAGAAKAENGHLPDNAKLPHHTSFNKFSDYYTGFEKVAGSFSKDEKSNTGWSFSEARGFKKSIEELYKNVPDKYKKQYYNKI